MFGLYLKSYFEKRSTWITQNWNKQIWILLTESFLYIAFDLSYPSWFVEILIFRVRLLGVQSSCMHLFQFAVSCFPSKPNNGLVSIIIGYNKANLIRQRDLLAITPLIFIFGFFKIRWRHQSSFWRIIGYAPNLFVQIDKNQTANEKTIEHHHCL